MKFQQIVQGKNELSKKKNENQLLINKTESTNRKMTTKDRADIYFFFCILERHRLAHFTKQIQTQLHFYNIN